jgi:hypothetical protein
MNRFKKTPMQPDPRDYEIRIWYSAEPGDEWSDWGERHGR